MTLFNDILFAIAIITVTLIYYNWIRPHFDNEFNRWGLFIMLTMIIALPLATGLIEAFTLWIALFLAFLVGITVQRIAKDFNEKRELRQAEFGRIASDVKNLLDNWGTE